MKTVTKLLVFVFFVSFFVACTPASITEDNETEIEEVYETGGNDSSEFDNRKGGD